MVCGSGEFGCPGKMKTALSGIASRLLELITDLVRLSWPAGAVRTPSLTLCSVWGLWQRPSRQAPVLSAGLVDSQRLSCLTS